ncbi:hypothetical protein BT96DRAFT_979250 [Gymnopus androsaceus JB14]|uniref:Uncharacterized protein n=1 Tax=Gymnopus androsaceus JB14 TaxID=1447944 RepID=A0A6A4H504_9AGAR|nr:hypothetical protein BT96DRAFT_979250 [Gymnopus androsaceus JB14]
MGDVEPLRTYFPQGPADKDARVVDILALAVGPMLDSYRLSHKRQISISKDTLRRDALVSSLYSLADTYKFFFVRGTPGSGKTTLCHLLNNYILKKESHASVQIVKQWQRNASNNIEESFNNSRDKRLPVFKFADIGDGQRRWLLFDEAQESYEDDVLWNVLFKNPGNDVVIVLFASYGSQGVKEWRRRGVTLNPILPHQRMNLWPVDGENGEEHLHIPGLCLLRAEFDELVDLQQQLDPDIPILMEDLRDWIFSISGGHIGAVMSILLGIKVVKPGTETLSWFDFVGNFPHPRKLLECCSMEPSFMRGLPDGESLERYPSGATYLRELLKVHNYLAYPSADVPDGAREAHSVGWVIFMEQKCPILDNPTIVQDITFVGFPVLLKLCTPKCFASFWWDSLHTRSSLSERILQSCPCGYWGHGLWLSPEFGTEVSTSSKNGGRIDFFVGGSKGWGIELLREGDRMPEHVLRFERGGPYFPWIQNGLITHHVVLDFHNVTTPCTPYEGTFLYHILFHSDFTQFTIQDASLDDIGGGTLLH